MKKVLIVVCLLFLVGCPIKHTRAVEKNEKKESGNVLDMELGDTRTIELWYVIKVHGGWIYNRYNREHLVFVKDTRETNKQTKE